MILSEHIDAAVKKFCPFGKTSCLMAGGCSIINEWRRNHRAFGFSIETVATERTSEALASTGRKGGQATAARRPLNESL